MGTRSAISRRSVRARERRHAARLAERIPAAHCSLLDINALPDAEALREHVCECHIGLVLGIHAYRAGRLLVGSGVPFAIVLGGTDMNVMLHDEPKRRVMLDAIAQACNSELKWS